MKFQEASLFTRKGDFLVFIGAAAVKIDGAIIYSSLKPRTTGVSPWVKGFRWPWRHRGWEIPCVCGIQRGYVTLWSRAWFRAECCGSTRLDSSIQDVWDARGRDLTIKNGGNVTGWAAFHGKPLLVPDVSKDERYLGNPPAENRRNQSELALTLMIGDQVVGLLNIEDDHLNAFTQDDQKVLGLLAEQLAVAFENIRLQEEARHHIQTLADMNQQLTDEVDLRKQAEEKLVVEFRIREAEHAIRLQIASMEQRDDLIEVSRIINSQLQRIGVQHDSASIRLVNSEGTDFVSISTKKIDNLGRYKPAGYDWGELSKNAQIYPWVIEVWKTGKARYEPCMSQDFGSLAGKSLIDVPFSHGTLAINEKESHAFADRDIEVLRRFSNILSEGFQRFIDLVDREYATASLRESEKHLSLILDATHEGFWDWNIETGDVYFSQRWIESLGYTTEEISYHIDFWERIVHPEDLPHVRDRLEAHFNHETAIYECQNRLLTKSGTWRSNLDRGRVVEWDADGKPLRMVGTDLDITEKLHLEQQLLQAQKMEAIGRLAGGVAHDFNNLLTIINGYSDILLNSQQLDAQLQKPAEEIYQADERAASLTSQLLAFSPRQVIQPSVFDLNKNITENVRVLHRLIGEDIELITKLDAVPRTVKMDLGQMNQIIMNLVVNARDAMPEGGKLTIKTTRVILDKAFCETHLGGHPGSYICLQVIDDGMGMDGEVSSRIFEPFFTTKPSSIGTGLGLSTVYGIVKQNSGNIWVDSEVGQGTMFSIYLAEAPPAPVTAPEKMRDKAQSGSGTLLIVEDDNHVRHLFRLALKAAGYTVMDAGNGVDALHLADRFEDPIHLLVTDIVMPLMNGRQLMERLTPIRPDMSVLYISGYTDDILTQYELDHEIPFLQKPFTTDTLIKRVKQILEPKGD